MIEVPFTPGRADASQAQTDVASFAVLEPSADGFRNYFASDNSRTPADMLVDRANLLTLSVPEMTVLVGGLRALNANTGEAAHGVLTERPGELSNDFFVNLLDMGTVGGPNPRAPKACMKAATAQPANYAGRQPRSTWRSGPAPSCGPSPRSTLQTMPTISSPTTSSPPGPK